jgi:prefoldin subunit 5
MEEKIEKLERRIKRLELKIKELTQPEFDLEKLWNLYNFESEKQKTHHTKIIE